MAWSSLWFVKPTKSFFAFFNHLFLAVLALCLNALAVGAPLDPTLRIFSPDPAAILLRLAWMLA